MQGGVGAVVLDVLAMDDEVGNFGAVVGGASSCSTTRLEASNCGGQCFGRLEAACGGVAEDERRGCEEAGEARKNWSSEVVGGLDGDG